MRATMLLVMSLLSGCDLLYGPFSKSNPNYGPPKPSGTCTSAGWCWQHPLPQGNDFKSVWGTSEQDIWAVGEHGTIYHYDGSDWSSVPSGMPSGKWWSLYGVWAQSDGTAWTVGEKDTLLSYNKIAWRPLDATVKEDDIGAISGAGGLVWFVGQRNEIRLTSTPKTYVTPRDPAGPNFAGVWAGSESNVWAVGEMNNAGVIYHGTGTTQAEWMKEPLSIANFSFSAVWGSKSVWAVGNENTNHVGSVYLRDDMSGMWQPRSCVGTSSLNGVGGSDDENVWAVGSVGTIKRLKPGMTCSDTQVKTILGLNAVWGSAANRVWTVGGAGQIWYYDGNSWSRQLPVQPALTEQNIKSVWASPDNKAWAVGERGTILHYDGQSWSAVSTSCKIQSNLNAVWGISANDVWVVGNTGTILHSTDGVCFNSDTLKVPPSLDLGSVWSSSDKDIWVVGAGGTILHSTDGHLFLSVASNTQRNLNGVWGSSGQDVWVVGDMGTILHSTNGGGMFTSDMSMPQIPKKDLRNVWGRSDKDVWIVGKDTAILRYDGSSKNWIEWKQNDLYGDLYGLWGTTTDLWATGQRGRMLHSIDSGVSWTAVDSGAGRDLYGMSGNEYNIWAVGDTGAILNHAGARLPGR